MAWFRASELLLALVGASVMALINSHVPGIGNFPFPNHEYSHGFGTPRGWPLKCAASAADGVPRGEFTLYRNLFRRDSSNPHLAVHWPSFVVNCLIAAAVTVIPIVLLRSQRARQKLDES